MPHATPVVSVAIVVKGTKSHAVVRRVGHSHVQARRNGCSNKLVAGSYATNSVVRVTQACQQPDIRETNPESIVRVNMADKCSIVVVEVCSTTEVQIVQAAWCLHKCGVGNVWSSRCEQSCGPNAIENDIVRETTGACHATVTSLLLGV